jgi:hypothetical protein
MSADQVIEIDLKGSVTASHEWTVGRMATQKA